MCASDVTLMWPLSSAECWSLWSMATHSLIDDHWMIAHRSADLLRALHKLTESQVSRREWQDRGMFDKQREPIAWCDNLTTIISDQFIGTYSQQRLPRSSPCTYAKQCAFHCGPLLWLTLTQWDEQEGGILVHLQSLKWLFDTTESHSCTSLNGRGQ